MPGGQGPAAGGAGLALPPGRGSGLQLMGRAIISARVGNLRYCAVKRVTAAYASSHVDRSSRLD